MKRHIFTVIVALLILSNGIPAQAGTSKFDGIWNLTLACEPTFNVPGYTLKIVAQVKDGMFLGQHGEENNPGYLKITGQIEPDGSSMLQATGLLGKIGPKSSAAGKAYNYVIKAQFNDFRGTGSRMSTVSATGQRNCDFVFVKK